MLNIGGGWDGILKEEFESGYYLKLREFLKNEYKNDTIYPDMFDIFNALKKTPYNEVKAVILGQDPYHGEGQAHGMCFSVREGVPPPPSLINIFKEIRNDLGIDIPKDYGCLNSWAESGVLLLNTVLTVRANRANSHKGMGWEKLTDCIIKRLSERETPMVFLLWGANARAKKDLIDKEKHLILECAHPSPFSSNGFFGCRHFSKTNNFLKNKGLEPIDWSVKR